MQANQTNAFVHERTNFLKPIIFQQRMSAAAIAVNDDGRSAIKSCCAVGRPTIGINYGRDAWHLVEARFQQQTTCAMLVLQRAMAWRTGDKDNFLVGGLSTRNGKHGR